MILQFYFLLGDEEAINESIKEIQFTPKLNSNILNSGITYVVIEISENGTFHSTSNSPILASSTYVVAYVHLNVLPIRDIPTIDTTSKGPTFDPNFIPSNPGKIFFSFYFIVLYFILFYFVLLHSILF